MGPGARNEFGALVFEPEVFWKQMYCFEKSANDIVVIYAPRSNSATGELCPPCPLITFLVLCNKNRKIFQKQTKFRVRTS